MVRSSVIVEDSAAISVQTIFTGEWFGKGERYTLMQTHAHDKC